MASQALSGVTVLDLTSYLAGPYAGTLLGDLGANVVKVEAPGGDMMRHYPSTLPGESRAYIGANRNKRGIVIDLKSAEGLEVFDRLVRGADVVIQNFRPGAAERLSVHYERLVQLNARLVYCSLTGFGSTGPMAGHPGFDQVLQCMSGIAVAQGADEGVPHVVWGSVVDYYAASLLAMSVCAALLTRDKTGKPQRVENSLLRSALALQAGRMVWADNEPREVARDLRGGRLAAIHPTKEGYLYVQAQTPAFWRSLCQLTGLDELADDPRYDDMRKRKEREDELVPKLRAALARRTAEEWEQIFQAKVPCTVVRPIEDMFAHPQVLAEKLVAHHEHPSLGGFRAMTGPVLFDEGSDETPDRRAPMLGEHTDEVLQEHGFSAAEIAGFRRDGAIQ